VGETRWTRRNPPNYVERAHYLLGRTVDSGRVWDLAAIARYLKAQGGGQSPVYLAGEGAAGVLCAYAALLEPDIAGVALFHPPASHMDDSAPALLNVLRVCDIAQAVGMVAPRPVWLLGMPAAWHNQPARLFQLAGASDKFAAK
jgi:dienelactone hydrolase